MDSKKRAIIVGALLHDIGKVGQRAQRKEELSKDTLDREGDICPGDKYSTHLHVLWTDEFFSKYFIDELNDKVIGEVVFNSNPQNLASFHHKPASSLQKLMQVADHISSGEREETERGEKDDYIKRRLSSIFNKVALKEEPKIDEPYFYNLTPLSLDKTVFPKRKSELDPPDGTQEIEKHKEKYRTLWECFIRDFKSLRDKTIEIDLKFELFLNGLYHLLMKYTWCVPSYTNARNEVDDDISLFDHSRTTAAIASCLYDIYGQKEVPNKTYDPEFLVLEGDISGIQKFLYKLARPSGIEGVGRILRGRSMFLTLLPIVTANYIADKLDQTFVNVLYAGGGNFQILLPNREEMVNRLGQLVGEIDKWLFDTFRGELGLVVGYVQVNRDDLGKGYGEVIEKLKTELENQKSTKFFGRLFEEDKFKMPQNERVCRVCGSFDAITNEQMCGLCDDHRDLGAIIPKSKYIILTDKDRAFHNGEKIEFGMLGKCWFLNESIKDRELNDTDLQWLINSTNSLLGFKFLGKVVPSASQDIGREELAGKEIENRQYSAGDVISFDHLDLLAEGDKKLGVLRMDIDRLGLIFSLGLSKISENWGISGLSISRAAMLSRMLDWFFTGYLNTLCKVLSNELSQESAGLEVNNLRSKVDCHYYIVYSGGDDLFVVAPWDETLELALRIRGDLKEFTSQNKEIDISGGLSIIRAKFPISRSGELAAEELDEKAKKERGSFSGLGETGKWDEIERSLELGKVLEKAIKSTNGKKLPRTFLNRALETRKNLEGLREDDPKRFLYMPELVYSITRNVEEGLNVLWKGDKVRIRERLWKEFVESKNGLESSGFGLKYALIKTRRR